MSGHNKWSTIKHKKGAVDAKRGKIFTKIIKEITVAARMGGGDPAGNPRLRAALLTARGANMPKDNVERAIKKGTGALEGADYVETSYEGYGPGGVAVFVEVLTDNKNRTVGEVRYAFAKSNGSMGTDGSVAWMFERKGQIIVGGGEDDGPVSEDQVMEIALEAGADDIEEDDGIVIVSTDPSSLDAVRDALDKAGLPVREAKVARVAQNRTEVTEAHAPQLMKLIDNLEDNDDVQNVYHNADFTDAAIAALG